jgi:hypothetical protein
VELLLLLVKPPYRLQRDPLAQSCQPHPQPGDTTTLFSNILSLQSNNTKLKTNKAAGPDNTVPELIKYGGRTLEIKLHELALKICNEEEISTQWNERIICPVLKKEDRLNCNIAKCHLHYTSDLINKRRMEIVEHKLGEQQAGFRPNRSNIDNIHSEAHLCKML